MICRYRRLQIINKITHHIKTMNAPPKWNPGSPWQSEYRDMIERVFVALRRECIQSGNQFNIVIDDFAIFMENQSNVNKNDYFQN